MKALVAISILLGLFVNANCQARIFCYYGSWRPDSLNNFSNNLCTHLVYSFISVSNEGSASADLQTFANLKSRFPSVKFLIAAGGWNDPPEKYSAIAADANRRVNFANNVLNLITRYNLDGFDLDWEYPVFREGRTINPADKANLILLLQQFRRTFASRPGLILSVAVAACEYQASKSYDVAQLSQNVDFINLMTYDLHGPWEMTTGLHSALYNDPASVDTCVNFWIRNGAQTSKLILGIPAYGKTWTLRNSNQNGVGAPATGPGTAGPITREAGTLSYTEICTNRWQRVFDSSRQVPYAFNGNQWVGYEDAQSVVEKTKFVKSKGLGGAMFWSIDLDDYKNTCGGGNYPLIRIAYSNLVGGSSQTPLPTNTPRPTTRTTTTTSRPGGGFTCPGDGIFRDPSSCNSFYNCAGGIGYKTSCGSLCFNPNPKVCDWCYNVPGC